MYFLVYCFIFYFFFQAEDGIRDRDVTGVQTCALPILSFSRAYSKGVKSMLVAPMLEKKIPLAPASIAALASKRRLVASVVRPCSKARGFSRACAIACVLPTKRKICVSGLNMVRIKGKSFPS